MSRPRRHIVVTLLPLEWDALVESATRDGREEFVQARWLILRALAAEAGSREPDPEPELTDVA